MSERELEASTGIPRVKLLNDFVANGYGVARGSTGEVIYRPDDLGEDKVRLVFGIGTGLGVCLLARPSEDKPFQAYPSEAGMVRMQHYSKADRVFHSFIIDKGYVKSDADGIREDVSMVLGGCALPWVAEYLAATTPEKYTQSSLLFQAHFSPDGSLKAPLTPETITDHARNQNDTLGLDVT